MHPHIIQFREVFLTEKYLAIAMEYAAGGDMFQHVKRKGGLHEAEASNCPDLTPVIVSHSSKVKTVLAILCRHAGFSSN